MIDIPSKLCYDPPKWFFQESDDMDKAIADDITSAIYWRRIQQLKDEGKEFNENDEVAAATTLANAIIASALQTDSVAGAARRATYRQFWQIQRNGYYRLAPQEYSSFKEYLFDRFPRLPPGSGEASDILFFVEHFFPLAEKLGNGWNPEHLLSMREHWSKTRAAVPYMRMITRQMNASLDEVNKRLEEQKKSISTLITKKVKDPEEIEQARQELINITEEQHEIEKRELKDWREGIEKSLEVIANPDIPAGNDQVIKAALFGSNQYGYKFEGMKSIIEGKTVYYFEVEPGYERSIENSLSAIAKFQLTDLRVIQKQVNLHFRKESE